MSLVETRIKEALYGERWDEIPESTRQLLMDACKEIQRLKDNQSGWDGYAWKNGEYIDDINGFFSGGKLF